MGHSSWSGSEINIAEKKFFFSCPFVELPRYTYPPTRMGDNLNSTNDQAMVSGESLVGQLGRRGPRSDGNYIVVVFLQGTGACDLLGRNPGEGRGIVVPRAEEHGAQLPAMNWREADVTFAECARPMVGGR